MIRFLPCPGTNGRGGWTVLVILIVVAIIMIAMLKGPLEQDPVTQVTQAQQQIDRGDEAAVLMNIRTLETELMQARIMGKEISMDELRQRLGLNTPGRSGGVYYLGPDGKIYHTKYKPPPPEILQQMVQINEEPAPQGTGPSAH